jgi:hypothetical protein
VTNVSHYVCLFVSAIPPTRTSVAKSQPSYTEDMTSQTNDLSQHRQTLADVLVRVLLH